MTTKCRHCTGGEKMLQTLLSDYKTLQSQLKN